MELSRHRKLSVLGLALAGLISMGVPAWTQIPLARTADGDVRIINTDMAVFEAGEPRRDLPCTVVPNRPALGFDLRFHSGFDVSVPMREMAGSENTLTILFRVTPEDRRDEPTYFVQRVKVPPLADDAKGDAYLQGGFDVGEGRYRIDWLMRDRSERVCSSYWDSEAALNPKDRQVKLVIAAGAVQAVQNESFSEEPPVARLQDEAALNVKVLLNYAPQNANSAAIQPLDTSALVAILRSIARDPHIGKFSLVAFNLHEQKVLYRQQDADKIDFPKLGEALGELKLGTVDLQRLSNKKGEAEFLADLIRKEIGEEKSRPDAVVFAGPKAMLENGLQTESLRDIGDVQFPVFFMNYNLNPQQMPWRDSIGSAVKHFKGYEFTISRPRDLWIAVTEMVSRIVRLKHGGSSSTPSAQ